MMRSLFSAVAGLRNHQTRMDVIGNNIANVNTVAFQPSRVIFQEMYSQTISAASGADDLVAKVGGTNPSQIGLGMTVGTIDVKSSATVPQVTGETFDLCIDGDGYFAIKQGSEIFYTRAGNFSVDGQGNLVTSDGGYVLGFWTAETGITDGTAGQPTLSVPGVTPNTWDPADVDPFPDVKTANLQPIKIDSNYTGVYVNDRGQIVGRHKVTDEVHIIGQVQLSTFSNPRGLSKAGGNLYRETMNSGGAVTQNPRTGYAGEIIPYALEMANVDIAEEFSNMIITQRGFQANSRIITVSDQMLEELVNMKR